MTSSDEIQQNNHDKDSPQKALNRFSIRTGESYAGQRIAVVEASKNAEPASMMPLKQYLLMQGIRALAGYDEKTQSHVLRLSSFGTDDDLRSHLTQRFPLWLEEHYGTIASGTSEADTVPFSPLNPHDQPEKEHLNRWQHYMSEHSDTAAGAAYIAGGLGMLRTALNQQKNAKGTPQEGAGRFKVISALFYTIAAANITYFTHHSDKDRSAETLIADIDTMLSNEGTIPSGTLIEISQQHPDLVTNVYNFLDNHPWEVSALLNSVGSVSHVINTAKNFSIDQPATGLEFISAMAGLTSVAIRILIPRQGQNSLIESLSANSETSLGSISWLQTLREKLASYDFLTPVFSIADKLVDWLQEKPLNISGRIAQASNIGYGVSGLLRSTPDPSYLATTIPYLVGDQFMAMSEKQVGIGYDEAVSSGTRYMHKLMEDGVIKGINDPHLTEYINGVATLIQKEGRILKPINDIAEGIAIRLGADLAPFQKENQHNQNESWRESSPFIDGNIISPSHKHVTAEALPSR